MKFLKKTIFFILFLTLITGYFIFIYDGPDLSKYDVAKIEQGSKALYNDDRIPFGIVKALPSEYTYLNSIGADRIRKEKGYITIMIWSSFTSEKTFTWFSSEESIFDRVNTMRDWKRVTKLLYSLDTDG